MHHYDHIELVRYTEADVQRLYRILALPFGTSFTLDYSSMIAEQTCWGIWISSTSSNPTVMACRRVRSTPPAR
ncbi:hypothetical protein [Nocardia sp. NPDC003963]